MAFSEERINKVVRYSQVFDFEFRSGQVKVMISKELTAFPVKNVIGLSIVCGAEGYQRHSYSDLIYIGRVLHQSIPFLDCIFHHVENLEA